MIIINESGKQPPTDKNNNKFKQTNKKQKYLKNGETEVVWLSGKGAGLEIFEGLGFKPCPRPC